MPTAFQTEEDGRGRKCGNISSSPLLCTACTALPGDVIKARMRGGALYLPLKGMSLPIFFSVLEKKRRTEGTTDGREATANDVRYFGDLAEASLGR